MSTAGFPGLEALTASVAQLAGLSIFHAGLIVLGLARLTFVVVLFLFIERVTRSARAGGIGVAVYACNPSFLYFDAQFAYESLALMIAATLLLVAVRWSEPEWPDRPRPVRGLVWAMALLAATVTITHHMSSYALLAFLAVWCGAHRPRRSQGRRRHARHRAPGQRRRGPGGGAPSVPRRPWAPRDS